MTQSNYSPFRLLSVSNLPDLKAVSRNISQRVLSRTTSLASKSSSRSTSGYTTPNEMFTDTAVSPEDVEQYARFHGSASQAHSRSSSSTTLLDDPGDEAGVNWKFANQGQGMLQQARDEALSAAFDSADSRYTRYLYVQGLSFLLHGLPSDLSIAEQAMISEALPSGLIPPVQLHQFTPLNVPSKSDMTVANRSILQRALSASMVQGFTMIQRVVPHIVHASSAAYQFNRDHKVAQNLATNSLFAIDMVGRSGLAVGGKVIAASDGMVGNLVRGAALWFLDGVNGGLHDGIEEIMKRAAT